MINLAHITVYNWLYLIQIVQRRPRVITHRYRATRIAHRATPRKINLIHVTINAIKQINFTAA